MSETELAPGASAGWLDVWRRIVNVAAIAVPIIVGVILQSVGVPGPVLGTIMLALFVALFVTALVLGTRVTRAMRGEMEAGYSTLYDVADFELRDARTKQLLRAATEKPDAPGRRSLLASMFTVKPGTLVAKRLEEDKNADER